MVPPRHHDTLRTKRYPRPWPAGGHSKCNGGGVVNAVLSGRPDKKRKRRTNAELAQLDDQIYDVLRHDHPQSVRHVFYRMTDPRLPVPVPKTEKGYAVVQRRCVELRRSGRVSYSWITDMSRRGYFTRTYRSAAEFLRSVTGLYRGDLWQYSDHYCEVWCESRSIAGVIEDDRRELAVDLYPAGGFSSLTLAFQSAQSINWEYGNNGGKPVTVLYIGDYDPAGVLIDVAIERELRTHLLPEIELTFKRIAITPEQIEEYGLPTKPRKESDRRALHIAETVEAEAMPAGVLRAILREHIEALLPEGALEVAKVAEESEREHIERMAELLEVGR